MTHDELLAACNLDALTAATRQSIPSEQVRAGVRATLAVIYAHARTWPTPAMERAWASEAGKYGGARLVLSAWLAAMDASPLNPNPKVAP